MRCEWRGWPRLKLLTPNKRTKQEKHRLSLFFGCTRELRTEVGSPVRGNFPDIRRHFCWRRSALCAARCSFPRFGQTGEVLCASAFMCLQFVSRLFQNAKSTFLPAPVRTDELSENKMNHRFTHCSGFLLPPWSVLPLKGRCVAGHTRMGAGVEPCGLLRPAGPYGFSSHASLAHRRHPGPEGPWGPHREVTNPAGKQNLKENPSLVRLCRRKELKLIKCRYDAEKVLVVKVLLQ